jgi:aryl-alcohol dehydrogenase-like predicted oxidoreductase
MEYGTIAGLDKKVSRLVQGAITLSTNDLEGGFALLDAAMDHGINTFDSAHLYGGGAVDRVLGLWMEARGNRQDVVIIGKSAHHGPDRKRVTPWDITADLYDTLARLRSDYCDIHLLHRDDPAAEVGPIVETLNEHKAAGRIHAFGGSNWSVQRLDAANEYADKHCLVPFAISSPNLSMAEQFADPWRDCLTISGPSNEAARRWYAEQRMPLFTWSSLARGFLSGRITRANFESIKDGLESFTLEVYCHEPNFKRLDRAEELALEKGVSVPQIALAWVLAQPLDVYPLIGAANGDEMQANIEAMELELNLAEVDWLDLRAEAR